MTQQAIQLLIEGLKDKDWVTRTAAAKALGDIAESKWTRESIFTRIFTRRKIAADARPAVPALRKALKDDNEWVRKQAARAIGKIGGTISWQSSDRIDAPELIELLKDEAWGVRLAAIFALGNIRDQTSVPHLIEALGDEKILVRLEAAEALKWLKTASQFSTDP